MNQYEITKALMCYKRARWNYFRACACFKSSKWFVGVMPDRAYPFWIRGYDNVSRHKKTDYHYYHDKQLLVDNSVELVKMFEKLPAVRAFEYHSLNILNLDGQKTIKRINDEIFEKGDTTLRFVLSLHDVPQEYIVAPL